MSINISGDILQLYNYGEDRGQGVEPALKYAGASTYIVYSYGRTQTA